MGIIEQLHTSESNRQVCAICGQCIPKDVKRISEYRSSGYGRNLAIRVCGLCIIKLAKEIERTNTEEIEKWQKKLLIKSL